MTQFSGPEIAALEAWDIRFPVPDRWQEFQAVLQALNLAPLPGSSWYVDPVNGDDDNAGNIHRPLLSIMGSEGAHARAAAGDRIFMFPGEYAEEVVISKSGLAVVGLGNRGSVFVAPGVDDGIAVVIDGTGGDRVSDVSLYNVGCEGDGDGGGLHVKGDVRRVRAAACKLEGGAFGCKLESTAAGSVSDTRLIDIELAWTTVALHLAVSGGGDPVTQTLLKKALAHNYTDAGVLVDTVHSTDLWILENIFAAQEDGSEPTAFIDADVADTTGLVSRNVFATTVWAAAKFALAAGVLFIGNQAQAEGPATGGGTAGRPD